MPRKHKPSNEVVRVGTAEHGSSHPPSQPVTQVQVIQDPNTGQQVQVIYDPNSGQYIPVQSVPTPAQVQPPQPPDTRGDFLNKNAIGKHRQRRIRVVEHPDGTRAYEESIDEAEVTGRTVSDDVYRQQHRAIPNALSKRRIIIGVLLAVLVLMGAADVLGLPHYRTSPGVYVGLEGEKTTDKTDLPMIVLIRMDRSVFGYTADGIGWCFGAIGGMIAGDDDARALRE